MGSRSLKFNVLPRSCPHGPPGFPLGGFFNNFDICQGMWASAWIQGGDFSPNGVFYYVHDNESADSSNFTGVHIFDVPPFKDGDRCVIGEPASEVTVVPEGYIRIDYDASATFDVSRGDELEGTTVYRGVDGKMHILTVKLSNELDDDDVTLFDHTTNEP